MTTYKELLEQREALERRISEARATETADAIAKVRTLVADFELTPEDVFPVTKQRRGKSVEGTKSGSKAPVVAKYRDPETGATWSGRGKPPSWIKDQKRNQFLIQ
jgi:DNA-binding protein H-NS